MTNTAINPYQRIMMDAYEDGEFTYVDGPNQLDGIGDTLFKFLFLELANAEDCTDIATALGRVHTARDQLDAVLAALIRAAAHGQR